MRSYSSELPSCKSIISTNYFSFSYLNNAQHIQSLNYVVSQFLKMLFYGFIETDLQFSAIDFLAFFDNVDFHIYLFREISFLLDKLIELNK